MHHALSRSRRTRVRRDPASGGWGQPRPVARRARPGRVPQVCRRARRRRAEDRTRWRLHRRWQQRRLRRGPMRPHRRAGSQGQTERSEGPGRRGVHRPVGARRPAQLRGHPRRKSQGDALRRVSLPGKILRRRVLLGRRARAATGVSAGRGDRRGRAPALAHAPVHDGLRVHLVLVGLGPVEGRGRLGGQAPLQRPLVELRFHGHLAGRVEAIRRGGAARESQRPALSSLGRMAQVGDPAPLPRRLSGFPGRPGPAVHRLWPQPGDQDGPGLPRVHRAGATGIRRCLSRQGPLSRSRLGGVRSAGRVPPSRRSALLPGGQGLRRGVREAIRDRSSLGLAKLLRNAARARRSQADPGHRDRRRPKEPRGDPLRRSPGGPFHQFLDVPGPPARGRHRVSRGPPRRRLPGLGNAQRPGAAAGDVPAVRLLLRPAVAGGLLVRLRRHDDAPRRPGRPGAPCPRGRRRPSGRPVPGAVHRARSDPPQSDRLRPPLPPGLEPAGRGVAALLGGLRGTAIRGSGRAEHGPLLSRAGGQRLRIAGRGLPALHAPHHRRAARHPAALRHGAGPAVPAAFAGGLGDRPGGVGPRRRPRALRPRPDRHRAPAPQRSVQPAHGAPGPGVPVP